MISLAKNEEQLTNEIISKVNLSKDKDNLGRKVINLSKCIINLSKESDVDIGSTKAQVVFVLDRSGSMDEVYKDGTLQNIINTLLPLGLTFDDNGSAEVYQFNDKCQKLRDLTINNYDTYVRKHMDIPDSTTKYSGPLEEILKDYFGIRFRNGQPVKKGFFSKLLGGGSKHQQSGGSMADTNTFPVFVLYLTDGDIDEGDEYKMNMLVRESSKLNCFIQFIGAGYSSFEYLRKLDNLDGRECDNTGFVKFSDMRNISDAELYRAALGQYAAWLKLRGF